MAKEHIHLSKKENDNWVVLLQEGASQIGISLSLEQLKAFELFLHELKAWGSRINLLHRSNEREIILKDFLDSMTVIKYLPEGCYLADLGSGAGFPGIPIKITRPDVRIVLLESREKRVFFLKNAFRILGLRGIEILRPVKGIQSSENFDFLVSRAFGSFEKLSSAAEPWLKKGGILLAMRGRKGISELEESLVFLGDHGWEKSFVETVRLPFLEYMRVLVGLRKI